MGLLIRLADGEDAAAIAAIYHDFVCNSRISFEMVAPSADEIARRIAGDGRGLHPWLVAVDDRGVLGFASASPFRAREAYRWAVETSVYLQPDAHGRGIGRQLLGALLSLLERQGFVTAVAGIALPNPASVALHERLGFVLTGTYDRTGFKMGEWLYVGHWQKELAERTADPSEPVPFADVI